MERQDGYPSHGMTFDELSRLSPSELENLRQREVEAFISRAPERVQRRLRGLQFEIDARRKTHKSALGACLSISRMMQASLERLHAALQGELPSDQQQTAQVIPFRPVRQRSQGRPGV